MKKLYRFSSDVLSRFIYNTPRVTPKSGEVVWGREYQNKVAGEVQKDLDNLADNVAPVVEIKPNDTLGSIAKAFAVKNNMDFSYSMPVDYRSTLRSNYPEGVIEDFSDMTLIQANLIYPGQKVWMEDGKLIVADEYEAAKPEKPGTLKESEEPEMPGESEEPEMPGDLDVSNIAEADESIGERFSEWWEGLWKKDPDTAEQIQKDLGKEPKSWDDITNWLSTASTKTSEAMEKAGHWIWTLPKNALTWLSTRKTAGIGERFTKIKKSVKDKVDQWRRDEEWRSETTNIAKAKIAELDNNLREIKDEDRTNETEEEKIANDAHNAKVKEAKEKLKALNGVWTRKHLDMIKDVQTHDLAIGAESFSDDALAYLNESDDLDTPEHEGMTLYGVDNLYLRKLRAGKADHYEGDGSIVDTINALGTMAERTNANPAKLTKLKIYVPNLDDAPFLEDGGSWLNNIGNSEEKIKKYQDQRAVVKAALDKYPGVFVHDFKIEDANVRKVKDLITSAKTKVSDISGNMAKVDDLREDEAERERNATEVLKKIKKQDLLTMPMAYSFVNNLYNGADVEMGSKDFMLEAESLGYMNQFNFNSLTFKTKKLQFANVTYQLGKDGPETQGPLPVSPKMYMYEVKSFDPVDMDKAGVDRFASALVGQKNVTFTDLDRNEVTEYFVDLCRQNGLDVTFEGDLAEYDDAQQRELDRTIAVTDAQVEELLLATDATDLEATFKAIQTEMPSVAPSFVTYLENNPESPLFEKGLNFTSFQRRFLSDTETMNRLAALPITVKGGAGDMLGTRINNIRNKNLKEIVEGLDNQPVGARLDTLLEQVKHYSVLSSIDEPTREMLLTIIDQEIKASPDYKNLESEKEILEGQRERLLAVEKKDQELTDQQREIYNESLAQAEAAIIAQNKADDIYYEFYASEPTWFEKNISKKGVSIEYFDPADTANNRVAIQIPVFNADGSFKEYKTGVYSTLVGDQKGLIDERAVRAAKNEAQKTELETQIKEKETDMAELYQKELQVEKLKDLPKRMTKQKGLVHTETVTTTPTKTLTVDAVKSYLEANPKMEAKKLNYLKPFAEGTRPLNEMGEDAKAEILGGAEKAVETTKTLTVDAVKSYLEANPKMEAKKLNYLKPFAEGTRSLNEMGEDAKAEILK